MKAIISVVPGLFLASPVLAHPGHDAALQGAAHYALSPLHGLGVIAVSLGAVLLHRLNKGRARNG